MHYHRIHSNTSLKFFFIIPQNICHFYFVLPTGHFVMTIQLIFDGDAQDCRKDIIFFISYTGLYLPLVHITVHSAGMPSCSYLFTVCNRCLQAARPTEGSGHVNRAYTQMQAGRDARL
jgi:hypothetical protein